MAAESLPTWTGLFGPYSARRRLASAVVSPAILMLT